MCTDSPTPAPGAQAAERPRRAPGPGPWVLGLVGPTGAGKSMVAHALAEDGARVLDADRIGHEVTDRDPEVRAALIREYGPDIYRADGTLDRAQVASRVFSRSSALAHLDRLVHPRIVARLRDGIAAAEREGYTGTIVVDAALLLDWGFERECHAVLAVLAPQELQVTRLMRSRGWGEPEARLRVAHTRSSESFRGLADAVVVNDGSVAAAVAAARAAVERLAARRPGVAG